jgi:hypothetical protein
MRNQFIALKHKNKGRGLQKNAGARLFCIDKRLSPRGSRRERELYGAHNGYFNKLATISPTPFDAICAASSSAWI